MSVQSNFIQTVENIKHNNISFDYSTGKMNHLKQHTRAMTSATSLMAMLYMIIKYINFNGRFRYLFKKGKKRRLYLLKKVIARFVLIHCHLVHTLNI